MLNDGKLLVLQTIEFLYMACSTDKLHTIYKSLLKEKSIY